MLSARGAASEPGSGRPAEGGPGDEGGDATLRQRGVRRRVTIALAPGALKFWWQAGVLQYITERFDIGSASENARESGTPQ